MLRSEFDKVANPIHLVRLVKINKGENGVLFKLFLVSFLKKFCVLTVFELKVYNLAELSLRTPLLLGILGLLGTLSTLWLR